MTGRLTNCNLSDGFGGSGRFTRLILVLAVLACGMLALTSCEGFFVDPALVSVTVLPATPTIALGTTKQMIASGKYDDGTTQTMTKNMSWSSSDVTVATISNGGMVTPVKAGQTTITAQSDTGISGTTTLTVTVANLRSLSVVPTSSSLSSGQTLQYTCTGTLQDGTSMDLTQSVTWASSSSNVATISSKGLATAATVTTQSSTNITASSAGVTSNTATLTVNP